MSMTATAVLWTAVVLSLVARRGTALSWPPSRSRSPLVQDKHMQETLPVGEEHYSQLAIGATMNQPKRLELCHDQDIADSDALSGVELALSSRLSCMSQFFTSDYRL